MKSNRLSTRSSVRSSGTQFRRKAVALGVAMAIASSTYANPTGMSVVAGQATAQTIGNLMQITNTPGAILNWQQFNIDVGQTTQFVQQNAASQVFNRVTGGDVSQILGTLQSNGQVFLINPAGVFFGQGAVVDTAGFLASTLAASDTDLLNGHLRFNDSAGTAGNIVNQGSLTTHSGGSIVLLAPSIENSGIIHADGEVLLAAGHSVTIVDMRHPTIGLTVASKDGDKAVNLGQIISKNASLFSHLVKNSGVVEATGAQVGEGGVIRFIAQGDALVGGQVLAESTQGQGGEIDITGQRVAVLSGARISADGGTGGGTVHVGGGWKGQDENLSNAQQTVVQANTHISANATANGNGGEVVVWADGHTAVDSEVQAKGGALGGNGGRVETSGKQSLAVNVAANTSAAQGEAGQWLIDPANLTIVDQIPQGGFNLENSSQGPFFSTDDISSTFSPTESFLLNSTVVAGLENNGFVQIYTTGTQPGDGNLTIAAPILIDQNTSQSTGFNPELFLEAKGEINIDAAVGLMPGQQVFDGFDLFLSYDIAKPVYVDAPLYLGNTGNLILSPYDIGTALPTNTQGQLPLDGVNLLSGMNTGISGPLALNRISVTSAVATDPMTQQSYIVSPEKTVKLNVLGANLMVNDLSLFGIETTPATDIRVGVDNFDLPAPIQGNLQYNFLDANSLTVDAGSTVSTFTRFDPEFSFDLNPNTTLNQLVSSGTVNFNGGFNDIVEIDTNAGTLNFSSSAGSSSSPFGFYQIGDIAAGTGSTINLVGSSLYYQKAILNGTFNMMSNEFGSSSFLSAIDTDLNGSFNIGAGFNNASFQALGMGATSRITLSTGSFLELGRAFNSSSSEVSVTPMVPAKQPGAYISTTQGQFVAQQGARIVMNGAATDDIIHSMPPLETASFSSSPSGGAIVDITGLDGRLEAPVTIEVNGFLNSIQTGTENFDLNSEVSMSTPINTMLIQSANIQVNAGGDGRSLRIGEVQFSQMLNTDFEPVVDLDFNGSLTVNSGRVRLEGKNVSSADGTLNVNGMNSTLVLSGNFTSADLYDVNRTNGGRLAAEGLWDNSLVNASNAATSAPLSKGNILVGDDLVVTGGLLTSAGTANSINIAPDSFLELRNTEVTTTINVSPTGVVLLATQDGNGAPVAPAVLNGATINMGGDAFLIVETDAAGVANLNGAATISSGTQGNLIIAGRRAYDPMAADSIPDSMTLNVGSGIRLNVTGNAPSLPPALQLFYGSSTPPQRPVFLVGQLTPEAVALAEYEDYDGLSTPVTTVLSGFANPSFVIDGTPDASAVNGLTCSVSDFCVKFDVAQAGTFAGSVITNLNSAGVTGSGVEFAPDLTLNFSQIQTPTDIMLMGGLTTIAASDLMSGRRLLIGSDAIARFLSNASNENISNNLENNGTLEFQGNYTLSGLLTGTGMLNNSGVLNLNNSSGSVVQNSIVNSGTINNTGTYTFSNLVSGTGLFSNAGTLNLTGSGLFGNSFVNVGTGSLNFSGGSVQDIYFGGSFQNAANVFFNGGLFTFDTGYSQSAGNLTVQPGTQLVGNVNINGGALRGFANITGNLNAQGGRIVPGASPGLMTVSGDLNLDANSIIDIEILSDGGVQGTDFDCIVVQGNANLAGQLNLIDISGGTLVAGSQYAFLEANTINGSFGSVGNSPASSAYTFSSPAVTNTTNAQQLPIQQMSTSTVALSSPPPPVEPPPVLSPEALTQSTGGESDAVSQNLNQAFTPTSTSTSSTEPSTGTTSTSSTQQTQQEEEAVEVANQSTAGTTISQQSNDIELKTTQSDPQRASAVCK
ncbi:filamentous hemagglutinin N-terminal domain-containing protein [Limnobacter sp.]|uniref:two-partner secretion domain-containing protein n=1 Tax=Limnobacter sp. TaxID=2003368 RepID=UPI0027BB1058|nr:filamentous hemagglutinin N-terminal domain-containing protein [Limnobacter sp.]